MPWIVPGLWKSLAVFRIKKAHILRETSYEWVNGQLEEEIAIPKHTSRMRLPSVIFHKNFSIHA